MARVQEVYIPDGGNGGVEAFELRPFQERVRELVRLFQATPAVRLRLVGPIAAGEPLPAWDDPATIAVQGPLSPMQQHLLPLLQTYWCPSLQRASRDACESARVITPLLVSLTLAGKAPIDHDPWLVAGVALLVARLGATAFCADHAAV